MLEDLLLRACVAEFDRQLAHDRLANEAIHTAYPRNALTVRRTCALHLQHLKAALVGGAAATKVMPDRDALRSVWPAETERKSADAFNGARFVNVLAVRTAVPRGQAGSVEQLCKGPVDRICQQLPGYTHPALTLVFPGRGGRRNVLFVTCWDMADRAREAAEHIGTMLRHRSSVSQEPDITIYGLPRAKLRT